MTTTTTPNPRNTNIAIIVSAIAILVTIGYIGNCNKKAADKQDQSNFINSLSDTIKTLRKDSISSTSQIASLQMQTTKQFVDLKIKDTEIAKLQAIVKSYGNKLRAGSSVTSTNVETHIDKTTPNDTLTFPISIDSGIVINNDSGYHPLYAPSSPNVILNNITFNPFYETVYSDKWINYNIKTYRDSTHLKLSINNEYSVVLGYNKKVPFADVINYNPYSKVSILRTFQVSVPKQKSWGVGFSTGVGFSSDLKPRPYIGIGINYNVIKF